MSLWDLLPYDIQIYILKLRAVKIIKNNYRKHPAIRSKYLARATLRRRGPAETTIDIEDPGITWALKFCSMHSKFGDIEFWLNYCYILIESIQDIDYYSINKIIEIDELSYIQFYIINLVNKYHKFIIKNYFNKNDEIYDTEFSFKNLNDLNDFIITFPIYENILKENKIVEYELCIPWYY